jgi:hypothetical protein
MLQLLALRQAYLSMVRRAYNPWLQFVQEASPAAVRCGCRLRDDTNKPSAQCCVRVLWFVEKPHMHGFMSEVWIHSTASKPSHGPAAGMANSL